MIGKYSELLMLCILLLLYCIPYLFKRCFKLAGYASIPWKVMNRLFGQSVLIKLEIS